MPRKSYRKRSRSTSSGRRSGSKPTAVQMADRHLRLEKNARRNELIAEYANQYVEVAHHPGMMNAFSNEIAKKALKGRGAYWGRELGSAAGYALGSRVNPQLGTLGAMAGGELGDWASDKLMSMVRGRGAYVTNNKINPDGMHRVIQGSGDEVSEILLTHREFLGDLIPSSTGFETLGSFSVNPGLAESFPWLSQIAQYYEEYEFVQLLYEVKSLITDGNTEAKGSVHIVSFDNPTSALYTNKSQLLGHDGAISAKVTDDVLHGVECDPAKRTGGAAEYIRTGDIGTQDLKTYDQAKIQISCSGCEIGLPLGELFVHYTVKLRKAKLVEISQTPPMVLTSTQLCYFRVYQLPTPVAGQTLHRPLGNKTYLNGFQTTADIYNNWLSLDVNNSTVVKYDNIGMKLSLNEAQTGVFKLRFPYLPDEEQKYLVEINYPNTTDTTGGALPEFTDIGLEAQSLKNMYLPTKACRNITISLQVYSISQEDNSLSITLKSTAGTETTFPTAVGSTDDGAQWNLVVHRVPIDFAI